MKNLRKEYNLRKERRNRFVKSLIEEAIINVLAEQEVAQPAAEAPPAEPPPVATPTNQPKPEPDPSLNASPNEPVQKQYTVDDMIDELNVIRGGRSFTDPEVYGKLVTLFKGLGDEQKVILDSLLKNIAEISTGVEEESKEIPKQPSAEKTQTPEVTSQPPAEMPQKKAPMPGAQKAAGAAGVGEV